MNHTVQQFLEEFHRAPLNSRLNFLHYLISECTLAEIAYMNCLARRKSCSDADSKEVTKICIVPASQSNETYISTASPQSSLGRRSTEPHFGAITSLTELQSTLTMKGFGSGKTIMCDTIIEPSETIIVQSHSHAVEPLTQSANSRPSEVGPTVDQSFHYTSIHDPCVDGTMFEQIDQTDLQASTITMSDDCVPVIDGSPSSKQCSSDERNDNPLMRDNDWESSVHCPEAASLTSPNGKQCPMLEVSSMDAHMQTSADQVPAEPAGVNVDEVLDSPSSRKVIVDGVKDHNDTEGENVEDEIVVGRSASKGIMAARKALQMIKIYRSSLEGLNLNQLAHISPSSLEASGLPLGTSLELRNALDDVIKLCNLHGSTQE